MGKASIDAGLARRLPELLRLYLVMVFWRKKLYSRDFLKDTWDHFSLLLFSVVWIQNSGALNRYREKEKTKLFLLKFSSGCPGWTRWTWKWGGWIARKKRREKSIGVKPNQKYFNGILFKKKFAMIILIQTKMFPLIDNKLFSSYLPFLTFQEKKKASFLWTIISKRGPLTKLEYTNTVFQENNAFGVFTCFPFFPAVIKYHIFTALLFPNLRADEGKGRVPLVRRRQPGRCPGAAPWGCHVSRGHLPKRTAEWGSEPGRGGKCCPCVPQGGWETGISPEGWASSKLGALAIKISPSVFDVRISGNFPRLRMESV